MAEGDGREFVSVTQVALLDDPEFLRGLFQEAVQAVLDAEIEAHLGAGRYEPTAGRTGYRGAAGAPGPGGHVLDRTLRALLAQ